MNGHITDIFKHVLQHGFSFGKKRFRAEVVPGVELVPVGDWFKGEIKTTRVMVGKTPVALPEIPLENRRCVCIFNNSKKTIYLGREDVTVDDGAPLYKESPTHPLSLSDKVSIYAVAATNGNDTRVMEAS